MLLTGLFEQFWDVFNSVVAADWFIPLIASAAFFAVSGLLCYVFHRG